mgnify:CR=1 FL=1
MWMLLLDYSGEGERLVTSERERERERERENLSFCRVINLSSTTCVRLF